jgi:hypothetical protein
MAAWTYLKYNVFKDVQKFNKALRNVYSSEPLGVTEEQKINMAVAIHVKKTKHMNYEYKDYDSKQWRSYLAWLQLKDLPKFKFPYSEIPGYVSASSSSDVASSVARVENNIVTPDSSGISSDILPKQTRQ